MAGLRLLLRLAPFLAGAVAATVWLRRRELDRTPLPAPAPRPEIEPPRPRSERFESEPVDIVTIVDDLLLVGR
ncbi:MAG: hypothetical protein ABWZ63_12870 [Thermoleophilaceae bacterium]